MTARPFQRHSRFRRLLLHPLFPVLALLGTGVVMVVQGQPDPIQRGSGVSVPVASRSTDAVAPTAPVLVLQDGVLSRRTATQLAQVDLPADETPIWLRQVGERTSALLTAGLGGGFAYVVEARADGVVLVALGRADRLAAGADAASVVLQRDRTIVRYDIGGTPLTAAIPLPEGQQLIGDSLVGPLASTQLDLLDVGDPSSVSSTPAPTPTATDPQGATLPVSSLYRAGVWINFARLVPIGTVSGRGDRLLMWSTQLRMPLVYDLAVPPTLPLQALGTQSLPVRFLPGVPGVLVTGPASISPDGKSFAIAGRVGQRPRLVVGSVDAGPDAALEVLSLGGDLTGVGQPAAFWRNGEVFTVNPLGELVSFQEGQANAGKDALAPGPTNGPIVGVGPG